MNLCKITNMEFAEFKKHLPKMDHSTSRENRQYEDEDYKEPLEPTSLATTIESTLPTTLITTAKIMSPSVTHVTLKNVLDLTCYVRGDATTISWWINGTKVDMKYILSRGGIFLDTTRPSKGQSQTESKLTVAEITHLDAGRYECRGEKPGFVDLYPATDSVSVTVIDPSTNSPLLYQASEITDEPSASEASSVKLCMFLLVICCCVML